MYVTMKSILQKAHQGNYAVVAANCINLETARAVVSAAEEENAPIIVNLGQGHMINHANGLFIAFMVKHLAEKASIPVALNLDHGRDFDKIAMAVKYGFSSVMIDASTYPLEENITRTKEVVKLAHALGITVEAELGHVGMGSNYNQSEVAQLYTDPQEAKYFIAETGVDALAVAVGTAHGVYKGTPHIDFERLHELKQILQMPLVLHGGSGTGDENLQKAVELGINKVNIFTDSMIAIQEMIVAQLKNQPDTDFLKLMMLAEQTMKEKIKHYIRLFGSVNKGSSAEPQCNSAPIETATTLSCAG